MMQTKAEHFQILMPEEFINDVKAEVEKAKERVFMQAMDVEPDEKSSKLLDLLFHAAEKKLDTRLHADYFSLLVTDGQFNYIPIANKERAKNRKERIERRKKYFAELAKKGVRVVLLNNPSILERLFPARGRNHMKIVVVDNVAWMGGINFHDKNIEIIDSMVKIIEKTLVDEIAKVFIKVDEQIPFNDAAIQCSDNTTLLIDGGKVGKSIILDHAIEIAEQSKLSIKLISPLIPDTKFLKTLHHKQKDEVKVTMIAPQIQKMTGIFAWVDILNDITMILKRYTIPIIFKPFMIHAKLLIVDDEKVIYGSHNFSNRGVRMGTEEIALESTDTILVKNLLNFYQAVAGL